MAWRRRKNGWPYADVMVKGKRHRGSLLLPREADTPGLWPDDEACERRYQNWLRLDLPRMMEGEKQPEKKEATLQDLVDAKLADLEARGAADRTLANIRDAGQHFSRFADRHHVALEDWDYGQLVKWLRQTSLQPSSQRVMLRWFKYTLTNARKCGLTNHEIKEWPKVKVRSKKDYAPLTPEKLQAVLEAVHGTHLEYAITFQAYTGVRSVDVRNLRWKDVLELDGARPRAFLCQVKTGGMVSISLSPPAVAALKARRAKNLKGSFVFTGKRGLPLDYSCFAGDFRKCMDHAGLYGVVSKRFRETVVSTLFGLGESPRVVQSITGHRSDEYWAYLLVRDGAADEAAANFAKAMSPEPTVIDK